MRFTYREFVEFSSAAEFRKFRLLAPITEEEIRQVDWKVLLWQFDMDNILKRYKESA